MLSYARLPTDERVSVADAEGYPPRAASGIEIPVISKARLNGGELPPAIRQKDGQRIVTVSENTDRAAIFGDEANDSPTNTILSDLTAAYPALTYTLEGAQQRQLKALDALWRGFANTQIVFLSVTSLLGFTPPKLERTSQPQFLVSSAALLDCGIRFVTTMLTMVVPARSRTYLRLNSTRGSIGANTASRIQMQGGHD